MCHALRFLPGYNCISRIPMAAVVEKKVRIGACLEACHTAMQYASALAAATQTGQTAAAKSRPFSTPAAASLKRCPDTNRPDTNTPQTALPKFSLLEHVAVIARALGRRWSIAGR